MLALLENPRSGSGDCGEVERLLRERGAEVRAFGFDQVASAVDARPERLVVAGGDGSIGPVARAAAATGLALAVVPVGTANDFARALGLPDDLAAACQIAAGGTRTRALELALMDDRPFVNVASIGLSPEAARRAHDWKSRLGPLAYALGALRAGLSAHPVRCRLLCDGEFAFEGKAWQVTVAATGAFGAGSRVEADPHDGLLDAVAVEAGSRLRLARRAHGMRRGTLESQRGVHSFRGGNIDLVLEASTGFNVDGEVIEAGSTSFRIDPRRFRVVTG